MIRGLGGASSSSFLLVVCYDALALTLLAAAASLLAIGTL